jgi:uncharacterized protein GlcG (DUF336 family)
MMPRNISRSAGSTGFEAPDAIRANRISIDGTLLDFIDATRDKLAGNGAAPALAGAGSFVTVRGYFTAGAPLDGTPYGSTTSGIRQATATERNGGSVIDNPDAFILVDTANQNRFPLRAGTDTGDVAQPLTQAEVKAVLEEAFIVMSRARGAIRQPLDSRAQVTISIVDTRGSVLGLARSPDAPVFGTDVALQKARTAAFFSGPNAAADLTANPAGRRARFRDARPRLPERSGGAHRLDRLRRTADRPAGPPLFPDGQIGTAERPALPPDRGLQPLLHRAAIALIITNLAEHIFFVQGGSAGGGGGAPGDTPTRCTKLPDIGGTGQNRLQNGIQIFPGGVPHLSRQHAYRRDRHFGRRHRSG